MTISASVAAFLLAGTSLNPAAAAPSDPPAVTPMLLSAPLAADQAIMQPAQMADDPQSGQQPAPAPSPAPAPPAAAPARGGDQNDIIVTARVRDPADPLQAVNAKSFAVTQQIDEQLVGPVAMGYKSTVPEPVRDGLHNFFGNLHEPVVAINYLLQLNIGKAAETLMRFTINTTVGLLGVFDVAKDKNINLPHRPNGFADTMGFYGVKPGPFFYLPLVGATTLRDAIGNSIDGLFLPSVVGSPFNNPYYFIGTGTVSSLDSRVRIDSQLHKLRDSADPYVAWRELYLKERQDEIDNLRGIKRDPSPPKSVTPGTE